MKEQILHIYERTYRGGWGYALYNIDGTNVEIFRFGHDSTSEMEYALTSSMQNSPLWEGTIRDLLKLVIEHRDIHMPSRKFTNTDFDHSLIRDFYWKIEEWGIVNNYLTCDRNLGGNLKII